MCGFVGYLGDRSLVALEKSFTKIKPRGPDNSSFQVFESKSGVLSRSRQNGVFWFHRLSINGLDSNSNQPMNLRGRDLSHLWLVCNGEIYNHRELAKNHKVQLQTQSDCEIIIHLYQKLGMNKACQQLDGVFAFCLYDTKNDIMYSARDRYGVRPSYYGRTEEGETIIGSEIKAMSDIADVVQHFPPGSWWSSETPQTFYEYFNCDYKVDSDIKYEDALSATRDLLKQSVSKRLMSDREIGCLLSGGLDSSLISSIVSSMSKSRVKTFSIGMPGSPDVAYAQKVADWIGSDHHVVSASAKDFIDAVEEVIYAIESYDTTTVRASVGNYLVGKYIRQNTDVKVVFNGDGSDEVCMGYLYNLNAPSDKEFFDENKKLLREIHAFDVLRSDRSVASHGLEARTPFLDRDFVDFYMSIPIEMKRFSKEKPEKHLLRSAFRDSGLLPAEVLDRTKCAFSDAVSTQENSWHKIVQNHIDTLVPDEEFAKYGPRYSHCQPVLKESYYYRKVFEQMFGKCAVSTIPHFWMPNWSDVKDPSARELDLYEEDETP